MIRNAVVHMNSEQPLMADLRALPTAQDACLVCTNLRYVGGKKPTFTDRLDSWFLIPLGIIRFVEVPLASIADSGVEEVLALPAGHLPEDDSMDLESESELLRRMREV